MSCGGGSWCMRAVVFYRYYKRKNVHVSGTSIINGTGILIRY